MGRLICALALLFPASAAAAPLGLSGCAPAHGGTVQCSGLVKTWDGVPLDTTVTLPADATRDLPLVVLIHGFGNSKWEYLDPASTAYTDNAYNWAQSGYAVLTYTARGLWGSCGTPESRAASPDACARGYLHLADVRFEARDTQELVGRLVDDGIADPRRIGVTGDSYGGGQSTMLAVLRDRVMMPDGRLVPWRSPGGKPLRVAAAAPVIPWTDLVYAIAPNGRTLTYADAPASAGYTPVGVEKASIASAVFASAQNSTGPGQPLGEPMIPGRPMGFIAPPGTDPEADVTHWISMAGAGEPYDTEDARAVVDLLERYHSAFHIDPSHPPAPLFVASGFTDDLFPVDEAIRLVNRTRRLHPKVPLSLMLADFGHQRASNKKLDRERLLGAVHGWLDYHLRRRGPRPFRGVTAMTQTCPRDAPSAGPFRAASLERLTRGEVRLSTSKPQTVTSDGGDPDRGRAIDPVSGGGDACVATGTSPSPGTAVYELPPATGYTLLGAPTILARLRVSGDNAQLQARLWDVSDDSQTLVARGSLRPSGAERDVWQLHANGWRFASGHVPKLELLGADPPYARPSNGSFSVQVRTLQLRLPVRQRPNRRQVRRKARLVVPRGQRLARFATR